MDSRHSSGRAWLWVAYGLLVLSCVRDIANPDIFWHLSAGDRILSTGRIPAQDWLSFTRAGAPWLDFEWLTQIVLALLYRAAGWWGLIALKTALIAGCAALLERAMKRRGIGAGERACGVAVLTAAWAVSNDMRPDWITMLLFCLELVVLEEIRERRWKRKPAATAIGAALAGALWANCHAGFAAGIAVAGVYALLCPVSARKAAWALVAGLFVGTFITPFGPRLYLILLEHARATRTIRYNIVEWHWSSPYNQYTLPTWAILIGCVLAAWAAPPRRAALAAWGSLAGLGAMALLHQRNIPYFAAAGVLLPSVLLYEADGFRLPALSAPVNVLLAAAFLTTTPQQVTREGLVGWKYPAGAASYLAAHPDVAALRIFNPWSWGGYLGWRLKPPYRVFFDGRYIFHDMLAEMMAATKSPETWAAFLDERKLDGALLSKDQPDMRLIWEEWNGARHDKIYPYEVLFMPPKRWSLVFEDDRSALYVRRERR